MNSCINNPNTPTYNPQQGKKIPGISQEKDQNQNITEPIYQASDKPFIPPSLTHPDNSQQESQQTTNGGHPFEFVPFGFPTQNVFQQNSIQSPFLPFRQTNDQRFFAPPPVLKSQLTRTSSALEHNEPISGQFPTKKSNPGNELPSKQHLEKNDSSWIEQFSSTSSAFTEAEKKALLSTSRSFRTKVLDSIYTNKDHATIREATKTVLRECITHGLLERVSIMFIKKLKKFIEFVKNGTANIALLIQAKKLGILEAITNIHIDGMFKETDIEKLMGWCRDENNQLDKPLLQAIATVYARKGMPKDADIKEAKRVSTFDQKLNVVIFKRNLDLFKHIPYQLAIPETLNPVPQKAVMPGQPPADIKEK